MPVIVPAAGFLLRKNPTAWIGALGLDLVLCRKRVSCLCDLHVFKITSDVPC